MAVEVTKPELTIFNPPEIQSGIVKGTWVDIYPMNAKLMSGPIEFNIIANDDYLDLNDTMLYISVRIYKDRVKMELLNAATADDIAFVNIPLYSLFSDLDIYMNDQHVEHGDGMYGYSCLLSNLLSYSKTTLENQLLSTGFVKDEAGKMDDKTNSGLVKRKAWNASQPNVFFGRLLSNVLQQPKYLLNRVNVRIKLSRQKPEFALMSFMDAATIRPVFEIVDAKLSVRRVVVSDEVRAQHERALTKANALYPYPLKVFTTFTIGKDERGVIKENLFNGAVPKMIVVAMVNCDAFNGMYNKNPYNFTHNRVTKVGLYRNNEPTPFVPFEPDFDNNQYLREYIFQYLALGLVGKDDNLCYTHAEYPQGYTFFIFNLTPDMSLMSATSSQERTNLTLKMKFGRTLPEAITVIVYAIFDGVLEIDANRQVFGHSLL